MQKIVVKSSHGCSVQLLLNPALGLGERYKFPRPLLILVLLDLAVMRHHDAGSASCVNSEKNFLSALWPWAYFTNGPNAAASIAPTLIRHCRCLVT